MANLFDPPPTFTLPLSKGGDLYCQFVYKPLVVDGDGDPVLDINGGKQFAEADYPAGATVNLTIDAASDGSTAAIAIPAVISGSRATVSEDHLVVDDVPKNTFWRVVITYTGDVDVVMCNGLTSRNDGK